MDRDGRERQMKDEESKKANPGMRKRETEQ
jgi:hypothetical protein